MKHIMVVLALVSTGCAANIIDTAKLGSNEGVLVSTINTNFSGKISIINQDNLIISSAVLSIDPGQNFRVISLPAGKYSWRGLYLGTYHSEFRGRYNFEIEAKAINYIGDLQIKLDWNSKKYDIFFIDHGDETKRYLKKTYPQLSGSHDFVKNLTTGTVAERPAPDPTLDDDEVRPPPPDPRAVIAKVFTDTRAFRDKLCACPDKVCADQVTQEMAHWSQEFGLDENSPKLTAQQTKELSEITDAMTKCRVNASQSTNSDPTGPQAAPASP